MPRVMSSLSGRVMCASAYYGKSKRKVVANCFEKSKLLSRRGSDLHPLLRCTVRPRKLIPAAILPSPLPPEKVYRPPVRRCFPGSSPETYMQMWVVLIHDPVPLPLLVARCRPADKGPGHSTQTPNESVSGRN